MHALEWLTLALVAITGYYAVQTYLMVKEMREARRAAVRPRLVPMFEYEPPPRGHGHIFVINAGAGTAIDIDVVLQFEPNGVRTRLITPILKSGDKRPWNPTLDGGSGGPDHPYYPDANPDRTHLRLTGTCRDVAGAVHQVDERTALRDEWRVILTMEVPGAGPSPV